MPAVLSSVVAASGVMAQDVFLSKPQHVDDVFDDEARCDYGHCPSGILHCGVFGGGTNIHCKVDSCPPYETSCWRGDDGEHYYTQPPRNLCEYGTCSDFSADTNQCMLYSADGGDLHCQVSACPPNGMKCWYDDNYGSYFYEDSKLQKPTRLHVCLDSVFEVQGGMAGFIDKKIKVGSSSSSSISHETKKSMSSKVASDVEDNGIFKSMKISASLQRDFEETSSEAFSQSEYEETETTIHIDLSKPAYYYRTTIKIETFRGDTVNLFGGAQIVKNTRIADDALCGSFNLLR